MYTNKYARYISIHYIYLSYVIFRQNKKKGNSGAHCSGLTEGRHVLKIGENNVLSLAHSEVKTFLSLLLS